MSLLCKHRGTFLHQFVDSVCSIQRMTPVQLLLYYVLPVATN